MAPLLRITNEEDLNEERQDVYLEEWEKKNQH
jgi:hypothetical protein